MRRATARGRIYPQSYSTDRRYGRLSLKACALFPLMWTNADDQGRLSGDPEEIKYACCPNIDHISKTDIPELLKELETQKLITVYNTSKTPAAQILDWWEVQRLQWAWPSEYPPPEGWADRLRYKKGALEVVTVNWGSQVSSQVSPQVSSQVSKNNPSGGASGEKASQRSPLTTLPKEKRKGNIKGRGNRRGNAPESSGEKPSPPLTANTSKILKELTRCFKVEWGRVPAHEPNKIIPRAPNAKDSAQLRDLARELSAAGGVPLDYIKQAFQEAASHGKCHISYVRAVLYAWLGKERGSP
ncbi:hypothetical protein ES707_10443 [subsurface metagenome]